MLEKIRDVLTEYIDVPRESIKPESRFLGDLSMNSLDTMDMIAQFEDEYDVIIPSEDLSDIHTVQDLMDYLNDIM